MATASPLVAGGLALRDWRICFTICLFISPDFDGYRAPKMKYCPTETHKRSLNPNTKPPRYVRIDMFHDMFHDMFVH